MRSSKIRQEKALAAANRRAYRALAFGAAAGAALLLLMLSVRPQITPEELAGNVKAQMVHKRVGNPAAKPGVRPQFEPLPARHAPPQIVAATQTNTSTHPTRHTPQYEPISFDTLSSFPFWVTDQMLDEQKTSPGASLKTLAQIPKGVRDLSEQWVSLRGFMLPMKFEGKQTTEFLLLRNQSLCCFGVPPKITEWVNVRMVGKGVKPIMDQPVTVYGTFYVGEVREGKDADLVGIYRLEADRMKGPRE